MSTPKKRGPAPGSGGRPPKQGAAMPERITIRASTHTARRWREIAARRQTTNQTNPMNRINPMPMSLDPSGPGRAYSDLAPLHRMGLCAIIALGMVVPGWIKSYLRRP